MVLQYSNHFTLWDTVSHLLKKKKLWHFRVLYFHVLYLYVTEQTTTFVCFYRCIKNLAYCTFIVISSWNTYHTKLHVQTVFLMMNPLGSKHVQVEDAKNWIKAWMKSVHFVGLRYIIASQCTVQKTFKKFRHGFILCFKCIQNVSSQSKGVSWHSVEMRIWS
jgi:hypothetical protein